MTPAEREVTEDAARTDGTWSPGAVAWRHGLLIPRADADVNNKCLGGCATRAEHERYNAPKGEPSAKGGGR